jgi:hypothetical protein
MEACKGRNRDQRSGVRDQGAKIEYEKSGLARNAQAEGVH